MINLYNSYYKDNFYLFDNRENRYILKEMKGFQKKALKSFHNNNVTSIIKTRQIGITTIIACYVSYLTRFPESHNYRRIGIYTKYKKHFEEIIYKFLNTPLNRDKVVFDFSSKHIFIANDIEVRFLDNTDQLRGNGFDVFIVDEATSFSQEKLDILLFNGVSKSFKFIICSSLGGVSDSLFKHFHLKIKQKSVTYKKQIILEKKNNIILEGDFCTINFE